MYKRILSIFLVFVFSFALVLTNLPIPKARAEFTYYPERAISYASQYYNKVVSDGWYCISSGDHKKLGKGTLITRDFEDSNQIADCAHFVSHCIGRPPTDENNAGGIPDLPTNSNRLYGNPGAHELADWLISKGFGEQKYSFDELTKGDVIVFITNNASLPVKDQKHHTVLYLGDNKYAAHSYCDCDGDVNKGFVGVYKYVHIKGSNGGCDQQINVYSIETATYGAENTWKDVAQILRDKLNSGSFTLNEYNSVFGDPISGKQKTLRIKFNNGSGFEEKTFSETTSVCFNKIVGDGVKESIIIKLQIDKPSATISKDGMRNFVDIGIDLAPFIRNGRTMVPLRFIAESFGCKVNWTPDVPSTGKGEIQISLDKSNGSRIVISMHTDSKIIKKQVWAPGATQPTEEDVNYDPAPFVVKPQGRTVVPLRFIVEAFGAQVEWKADTQEIKITFVP